MSRQLARRELPGAGDPGPDAPPAQIRPAAAMIIGLVGVDLGRPGPPAPAGHPDRRDVLQHGLRHRRVVGVGRADHHRDRQPAGVTGKVQLGPRLAPIDRVCAGQVPPLTARRLKESTLTRSRSMRPASPSSSSGTACSCANTPALAHVSSRRQQVVALPQPSSMASRRLQGVLVRARKISAATQLRSGMRRGTPPRERAGGGGSNGLDALPQLCGEESVDKPGHTRASPDSLDRRNSSSRTIPNVR